MVFSLGKKADQQVYNRNREKWYKIKLNTNDTKLNTGNFQNAEIAQT